ncbi:MAG: pectinesterase family protein [Bacteroidetes bacterium]|nr:pectinesterase family protein [Bacteroidota bacterium]
MVGRSILFSLVFISIGVLNSFDIFAQRRFEYIVAKDGSGQFRSIQEAIDAVPFNRQERAVIIVKKGVYEEKLFIAKSNIAIVGEDRDSTRIVYPQLRSTWRAVNNDNDYGSAVVNIDSSAVDITIANLTIYNNYGSLTGIHDHQFAIYGTGTRIILLNCNVVADGGDTVSLWNRTNGMYYHANCYFEGWVDYVCPRGWCYITDSRFYGHNLSASIWHDGSANKKQKFVIRYSYFDGVPGFPLGRNHRDGQIYLLDCIFSRNMADIPIYYPPTTTSGPWKWGARHYYYNCHREGGDYDWFADNLHTAEGAPKPDEVTAHWTFDYLWDPEASLPAILPFVSMPVPRNGAYIAYQSRLSLRWLPSRTAQAFRLFFGKVKKYTFMKDPQLSMIAEVKEAQFEISSLEPATTYFWQVEEITPYGILRGPVWHFTVR